MITAIILFSLVVLLLLGVTGGFLITQWQTKKAVKGKLWCTFISHTGSRYERMLTIKGNNVRDEEGNVGTDYKFNPNKCWNTLYPPGRPQLLQVTVRSAIYATGNPEPWDPHDNPCVVTSEVLRNTSDEAFSRYMLDKASRELRDAAQTKSLNPLIIYLGLGACALLSVFNLYTLFKLSGAISGVTESLDKLSKALGV